VGWAGERAPGSQRVLTPPEFLTARRINHGRFGCLRRYSSRQILSCLSKVLGFGVDDISAQNTEPLPRLNQFFVRKCSDKFAVIVLAEFTEPDWAGHRDTHGWSAEEGDRILQRF